MNNKIEDGYQQFLQSKSQEGADNGFEPVFMPPDAFDFQQAMIEWSVRKGRAAIFEDCGLGKTLQGLAFAQNVAMREAKPVLYLTPMAVGPQTIREAHKFGIEATLSRDGSVTGDIVVTNYEKLHLFDSSKYAGVVCDESSILKSFDGRRKTEITAFMRKVPYRLLQTATAAPNDFIELGTSSEALGYLGHVDMLNRFFKNDMNNSAQGQIGGQAIKWRLKGHAELPFWRWVCSWARAIRRPSDIGFDDSRYVLPDLIEREHLVHVRSVAEGYLFNLPAVGLKEQREEQRRTVKERCELAAALADTNDFCIVWCHLNEEGDLLQKLIPGSVQVSGKDSDDSKERKLLDFSEGRARVLITKPKIGAWGLNFQHCNHVITFPSNSFEQYYQAIRRCYRFGQLRPVTVDLVTTEGGQGVMKNLQRKSLQADRMFGNLVQQMNNAAGIAASTNGNKRMELPAWL